MELLIVIYTVSDGLSLVSQYHHNSSGFTQFFRQVENIMECQFFRCQKSILVTYMTLYGSKIYPKMLRLGDTGVRRVKPSKRQARDQILGQL